MNARLLAILELAAPIASAVLLLLALASVWVARVPYPFDLEWMEGGMLAHAWRLSHGLPLYVEPGPEFVPYIYPPGYPVLLASFGALFGLTPALGRILSLVGTLAAAAAISFIVVRQAKPSESAGALPPSVPAFIAAVVFLGTYPATGAFFDLVRSDGVLIGLLAWSVALSLEEDRRAPIASGLLLFFAFLMKHNAAVLGLPIACGIALRGGRRDALRFAASAALPALIAVVLLQWQSEGRFLEYLIAVPRSHPSFFDRVWPGTFREVGTPLPFVFITLTAASLWLAMHGQQTWPLPVTTLLPVAAGMLCGLNGTYVPPPQNSDLYNVPSAMAFFAFGAVPVSLLLYGTGALVDHRVGRWRRPDFLSSTISWRLLYALLLAATLFATSAAMRAHNGGFLNVHIQLFWGLAAAFGILLQRMVCTFPTPAVRVVVSVLATAQLLWSFALFEEEKLLPTEADYALGDRLVAAARSVDGEVLSPFAAWIPVYAGKPPSLHYMGLWDLEYKQGPFYNRRDAITRAVEEHRWALVLGGNQKFGYELQDQYRQVEKVVEEENRALMPKTGYRARPNRIMVPNRP